MIYSIERGRAKLTERSHLEQIEKHVNGELVIEKHITKRKRKSIVDLKSANKIYLFLIFLKIIITYFIEEAYFLVDNNHIFDREAISYRNFFLLISLFTFSQLLLKNNNSIYRHQIIPITLILMGNLAGVVLFFIIFVKIFQDQIYKLSIYSNLYILLGLEFVFEKILIDFDCINIFLLLGIKSVFGTITFSIIRFVFNKRYIVYADTITCSLVQKGFYVVFLLLIEFLKLLVVQNFSPSHIFCSMQLGDLLYFLYYTIERTIIYNIGIPSIIPYTFQGLFAVCSFIFTLVFCEFLILNFCNMNENTKMSIRKRSENDMDGLDISIIELGCKEKENESGYNDASEVDETIL